MRNLQELHERNASQSQSHRSFYVSPQIKLKSLSNKQFQHPLNELKAIFSKANKLEFLVNPYSDRKTASIPQKNFAQKISLFKTPIINSQKTSFIINKSQRHGNSFFEKREKPNKPFIDQTELKKLDFMKTKEKEREKERERERENSLSMFPEGFYLKL